MIDEGGLILISNQALLLSIAPLLLIAWVSHNMGLAIESPIVVGILRTLVQLSVLGAILAPIFNFGHSRWWVVTLYVVFMVVLSAQESSARSNYYFRGMFAQVFWAFAVNIAVACLWTFGVILRPTPLWEPQYVIPITGMLLGNCINGVALSLNTALSSLVEQSNEVELLLAFGATPEEAAARLMNESIRVGAMPLLNTMAVIGLISIPGMMTGQILGGTPPFEAAKYQMLIVYLIAMSAFGTILTEVWLVKKAGFDAKTHMLHVDTFIKRPKTPTFLERLRKIATAVTAFIYGKPAAVSTSPIGESLTLISGSPVAAQEYDPPQARLDIFTLAKKSADGNSNGFKDVPVLEAKSISKSFEAREKNDDDSSTSGSCDSRLAARTLFRNLSFQLQAGEMLAMTAPSGAGKTQLLRILAGLSAMDEGTGHVHLMGKKHESFQSPEHWRRQVRYVSQYKIDIPGTPSQFIEKICRLKSWTNAEMPSLDNLTHRTRHLLVKWGLDASHLEYEWKSLSGGEAQRIYLAIAVASEPKVLLLDESTSALDANAKERVEISLKALVDEGKTSIIWVTHDSDQIRRLSHATALTQRLVEPI